ncbi:hypothetical protein CPB85DRAFT_1435300 [Mucidula mucida]|nr:hypothetical protein CPB85DRAFT_1435300 [Mucidula mucida]
MSQETAARSSEHRNEAIVDPANYRKGVTLPSEAVQPTRSTTQPQQGATQPGSGHAVHEDDAGETGPTRVVEVPADSHKAPFKERVVGAALKTRGTLLGKPELKETGQKVFDGELDLHEAREAVHQK